MYITLEISRPIQWKPKVLRFPNVRVMIVEWLYFAIHINPTYTPAQIIKATGLAAQREAIARAEAAEKRVAELEEGIKAIDNAVEIQCHDGNWNYDSYMHGMANGLLLAQAYMAHPVGTYDSEHYKPLSAPERWLSDGQPG